MKRIGRLWSQVTAFENLYLAFYQVLRGKRGQVRAGEFFQGLEKYLFQLQSELVNREYVPGPYRSFWIEEPKPRMISAAPFRDRIVHTALVNVLEPVFERQFIFHSYACRKGKGTHRALAQFVGWARSSRYVLKLDIHKFFPSIDHAILKERLRRTIKDPEVLRLCDLIIDHSNQQEPVRLYFPGDDLFSPWGRRRGIPIGNLTSQFFANVYLDELDHFLKDRLQVKSYLRYVDDFGCFHDQKQRLKQLRRQVREFLENCRLRLNEGKSRIRQVKEGIEFLGFVVFPDELRLNQSSVRRERRRIQQLQKEYAEGLKSWNQVKDSLQAWNAHASYGTTWRMREGVFQGAAFYRRSTPSPNLQNPILCRRLRGGQG